MNITEVRVKLLSGRSDRLRAFCSITIDNAFVLHDLRVIDGRKGMFVAMPSRKLSDNCPRCGGKNHLRSRFCSECGAKLEENRAKDRDKFHVDVAHPILPECRELVQSTVLAAYKKEIETRGATGAQPDSGVDDYDDDYPDELDEPRASAGAPAAPSAAAPAVEAEAPKPAVEPKAAAPAAPVAEPEPAPPPLPPREERERQKPTPPQPPREERERQKPPPPPPEERERQKPMRDRDRRKAAGGFGDGIL